LTDEQLFGWHRAIPLDGRPQIGKEIHLWMGDSSGLAARFRRAHPYDYWIFEDGCHEGEQSADKMLIPAGIAQKSGKVR